MCSCITRLSSHTIRSTFETTINAPRSEVAALLANPDNNPKWMHYLTGYTFLGGKPGTVGSTFMLKMGSGSKTLEFIAHVTRIDLPNQVAMKLDSKTVSVDVRALFFEISHNQTRYVSDQVFIFKGFWGKALGFIARPTIKKQQQADMMYFKDFAEKTLTREPN